MKELVFATNNLNKLEEIRNMLGSHFHLVGLQDIGCLVELPETHDTLEQNALEKANFVYRNYEKDCFADDTGFEIFALDRRPGVYSARYSGIKDADPKVIAEANINKVLEEMKGLENKKAMFRTVIALLLNGKQFLVEGVVQGTVIGEKRGTNGFGYDPIFIPSGYNKTFAEMNLDEKNQISHRAIAFQKLTDFLRQL